MRIRPPTSQGFTLMEVLFAGAIAAIAILGTLSLLMFARMKNELEQERIRAHQIVCQALDVESLRLFTWTRAGEIKTIWDNGTPGDATDDTIGMLEIIVRNPDTGEVYARSPEPAVMVEIEATMSWEPRGPRPGDKIMRESAITYKSP